MFERVFILAFLLLASQAVALTDVFFSPNGGCEQRVVELTNASTQTLDVAIYSLNNPKIIDALIGAHKRGVKVRVLLDRVQASGNRNETLQLKSSGLGVRIHSKNKIQHNKFGVFDGKTVVTGSFNWTRPAENSNEENCLFADDDKTVNAFKARFTEHLWVVNSVEKSNQSFSRLEQSPTKIRKPTSESVGNTFYK